jgi:Cu/Ag efflux pump CusA
MVLAGLAIAVGEVVDDAIIDVENIVRRLRQNRLSPAPRSSFLVVLDASLEVRSAVVFATFIVGFVCLPIFFMSGVAGSFFRPLALAYLLAVLASLVVALTVTPAMALLLLPSAVRGHSREAPLARAVRAAYRRLLPLGLRWGGAVPLGLLVALAAGAAWLYPHLKEEYLPRFQETDFLMHWVAKPGTGIDVVREDVKTVSREMRAQYRLRFKADALAARGLKRADLVAAISAQTGSPPVADEVDERQPRSTWPCATRRSNSRD